MDEGIRKNIAIYFSHFYKHSEKWKNVIQKVHKPWIGLKNQAEQLNCIEKVNIESEFDEFPGLKEKLLFKVFNGIDGELLLLRNIVSELNVLVQELRNKLVAFERSTNHVDWAIESSICGDATRPSLPNLLQMGLLGWRIYTDKYQNLSNTMKSLDVRNEKTFNEILFTFTPAEEEQIREIIAITQYCYDC